MGARVVILGSIWFMDGNGVCRGIEDNMRLVKSNVEHCADFLEYRFIDAL